MSKSIVNQFIAEINSETPASRNCIAGSKSEANYEFQPHPKSMKMGYLVLLVAEIPLWIHHVIEDGVIDLAKFPHFDPKDAASLAAHFDENIKKALSSLEKTSDQDLDKPFELKMNGQTVLSDKVGSTISSSINHWVHHRGQLTVYLRLKDLPVPSIYGPSGDTKQF
jgi:uncharacterized damage-inducible protein DinB